MSLDRLGPQYHRDNSQTARMRLHQSWWRSVRLEVEWGTDRNGTPYGNLLAEVDAKRGLNFLTESIHQCALRRMNTGPGVEEFRCTRNLLSSQPMAFNLFGPLSQDHELAARLMDPLLPGGASEANVRIEWAPPKSQHLADNTSFDVAVRYKTRTGKPALAGIETKLTEPFSRKTYGYKDHHTEAYQRVARSSKVWRDPTDDRLSDINWNQVWRNHLLVESIRQSEPGLLGSQIVVLHPLDKRCASNVAKYVDFLSDPGQTFRFLTLSDVLNTWRPLLDEPDHQRWLDDFEDRYINLFLSESSS